MDNNIEKIRDNRKKFKAALANLKKENLESKAFTERKKQLEKNFGIEKRSTQKDVE
jgi:hypothetical protein